MDFTELETTTGGIWRIGALCDYWAKPALAGRVAATATATDLIATLEDAITAAEELLGHPLILDCIGDRDEIEPIAVVTDNGGPMRWTCFWLLTGLSCRNHRSGPERAQAVAGVGPEPDLDLRRHPLQSSPAGRVRHRRHGVAQVNRHPHVR